MEIISKIQYQDALIIHLNILFHLILIIFIH